MCGTLNLRDDLPGENIKLSVIDTQELKYKYQMGVVSPVVYTLTYVYLIMNLYF